LELIRSCRFNVVTVIVAVVVVVVVSAAAVVVVVAAVVAAFADVLEFCGFFTHRSTLPPLPIQPTFTKVKK
jgi:hypothetical protein